jgi:hypothetical protein
MAWIYNWVHNSSAVIASGDAEDEDADCIIDYGDGIGRVEL